MRVVNWIALILIIIGALNWGMIGFFGIDVIGRIFGSNIAGARTVFAIIGLAGLWSLSFFRCLPNKNGTSCCR